MAFTLSISDVIKATARQRKLEDKIKILRENNTVALRSILTVFYDPENYVWNLPTDVAPPYTPSPVDSNFGVLYNDIRYLRYFIKGQGGDDLSQMKRETLFIQFLESINKGDAELIIEALTNQGPIKGIPVKVINEALNMNLPDIKPKKTTSKKEENSDKS